MQKEALIAIFTGLVLGLATTAGVYYFKVRTQEKQVVKTEETLDNQLSPTPTPEVKNQLALNSPLDGLVTLEPKVTVEGEFIPNTYIVLTDNQKTQIFALENKDFQKEIDLEMGPNMIYTIGIQTDGHLHPRSKFVFRDALPLPESSMAAVASGSANLTSTTSAENTSTTAALLARINKKIKKVKAQNKRAVFGEITKVTEESITLSNSTGDFTFALKDTDIEKKGKEISVKEIEVGKWGTMVSEVIDPAEKTKELTPTLKLKPIKLELYDAYPVTKKPEVVIGNIKQVKNGQLVVTDRLDNQEVEVKLNKSTKIYDLNNQMAKTSDLDSDINVIVVAEKDTKDNLVATQLKVLTDLNEAKDE